MRPPKKILLFSVDEDELSRTGYLLWVKQYNPVLAVDGLAAMKVLSEQWFDCAMVMASSSPRVAEAVVRAIAGARPDLPIVVFAPPQSGVGSDLPALVCQTVSVAEMLERLRVVLARKRGPKAAGSNRAEPRGYLTSDLQRVG